jgi:hypothetical protein
MYYSVMNKQERLSPMLNVDYVCSLHSSELSSLKARSMIVNVYLVC